MTACMCTQIRGAADNARLFCKLGVALVTAHAGRAPKQRARHAVTW